MDIDKCDSLSPLVSFVAWILFIIRQLGSVGDGCGSGDADLLFILDEVVVGFYTNSIRQKYT